MENRSLIRNSLRRWWRRSFELFGSRRYSWPALNNLDRTLYEYLHENGGFFIEAGANNGYDQSNTYYLERFLSWKGILIEPIPSLYKICKHERSKSLVINCALVPSDYERPDIEMFDAGLMSIVKATKCPDDEKDHLDKASKAQKGIKPFLCRVPARTLTSILDEYKTTRIDLLSLDTEGYELNALKGLDLDRYHPKFILIEANQGKEIRDYLRPYYGSAEMISPNDILFY